MKKQIKGSSSTAALPAVAADGGLAQYVARVKNFPILSKEEEYAAAVLWAKSRDKHAAEKLISSHLRLVVSMAYELRDYGIPVGDLVASGNLGLMQALQRFEPEKGFRFSTYATFWIKAEMYDTILNNWSIVKLGSGAAQKKVFFNLARAKRALGIMDGQLSFDQAKQIAQKLDVTEDDVMRVSARMQKRDMSLNAAKYDESGGEIVDYIEDDKKPVVEELEEHELRMQNYEMLRARLAELPERERDILVARRLSDPVRTLEELSAEYGISRERVRQIEERAFEKLRKMVLGENKIEIRDT